MDVATLNAALPAATIAAVSEAPNGLDDAAEVYVDRRRRQAATTPEAWWRPVRQALEPGGLGVPGVALEYELLVEGAFTAAALGQLERQLRLALHGRTVLSGANQITGLDYVEVLETDLDLHDGAGTRTALLMRVAFHGDEPDYPA